MITVCGHNPQERPEKHGGQTFSTKHHQQRNNRLRYKQDLVTTYQDPLQLHGQTTNLLHQDAKHGIVECGRCIRWRSILAVLQLRQRCGKASASSSCGDLRQLSDEWMSMGNHLGAPRQLYLCPWGALGSAPPCLAWDPPWERSKLGLHKISIVQIFLIRSSFLPAPYLPCLDSK
jgi:hypothetical protein